MFLLIVACGDRLLTPLPGHKESWHADSAPDSVTDDTGRDSGESCGERTLGAADGAPLARSAELDGGSVTHFGIAIKPGVEAGAPRVWVQASLGGTNSTAPKAAWNGAYLLGADAWASPLLPSSATPRLYSDRPTYELQPWLHRSGLTTDAAYPGEASWFADSDDDGSVFLLFTHPPAAPAAMADAADATLTVRYNLPDRAITADLDNDGLDDLLVPGWPIHVFLSPMAGALTQQDADHIFEMGSSDNFGWDPGGGHAAADLDGDGYTDLVWEASPRRWGDTSADDVFYVRGPILTRESWAGADGALLDDTPGDPTTSTDQGVYGEAGGIRAAGDLTGDGREDVTVHSGNEAYGQVGSSVLYVVDHPVIGTEELAAQPIRLVGLPTTLNGGGLLVSGGSGDVNGDGLLDLAAFESRTGLSTGQEYRSYLVFGPINGLIDLENEAVNIRLPADTDTALAEALIVPDLDADGLDDVVFSTWGGGEPGLVWLFRGCAAW